MLTTVWIGGIEVVSLLDGVEDLDDHDILDPSHGPSDPVWEPFRRLYPAVFATHGGWRLHVRGTTAGRSWWTPAWVAHPHRR